jgi:CheY-like chemotaxis protein
MGGEAPLLATDRRPFALVVEDDEAIGSLLTKALIADGCDAEHVLSGDRVADVLRVRRPDIILLDAMLPGVHGFEICAALKASPEWRSVPIAMVSAVYRSFEQVREIHERHGADVFIEKPFQLQHVRRIVADLLRRSPPVETRNEARDLSEARTRALVDHHLLIGDVDGATALVERWLVAEPLSARAWLERGHLAITAADHFRALQAYELAALYDRRLFLAQVSLASLSSQLGFTRKAHDAWLRAASCAPDAATADQIRRALAG